MAETAGEKIKRKAAEMAAKNATSRQAAAAGPVPVDQAAHHLPAAAGVQVKPIRSTIDLAPVTHAALKSWCGDAAVAIGVSRITTQDVGRVLVARLLADPVLAAQIRDDLRTEKAK